MICQLYVNDIEQIYEIFIYLKNKNAFIFFNMNVYINKLLKIRIYLYNRFELGYFFILFMSIFYVI